MNITVQERSVLYGLLTESTSDIILKTDRAGMIVHASPALQRMGCPVAGIADGARVRLADLVAPEAAAARGEVERAHAEALAGRGGNRIEFPVATSDDRRSWYEIRIRALQDDRHASYGALCVMRSIDERRDFEQRLFAATYTDPLTRLTNRAAFISMLEHMLDSGMDGCLAMFSIDFFRTINLQHGQSTGDEVLVVFADLLREMLRTDDLISRIGSERFAVLLPRTTPEQAQAICTRVITTLAELRRKVGKSRFTITASASIARIGISLDSTMERAEMALFVAKAKGRNRLEMEKPLRAGH